MTENPLVIIEDKPAPLGGLSPSKDGPKKVHLLVMGLTGAGKSTFISRATGDKTIPIDDDLDGGTSDISSTSERFLLILSSNN